jgi:CII-binding regulator of phage lambda lysogenization HflD
MPVEPNGDGPNRLDRMERLVELLVDDHVLFRDEHKRLLTAQVVLSDQMSKLSDQMSKLSDQMSKLAEAQKHTDERLNDLIGVVDGMIRNRPPQT